MAEQPAVNRQVLGSNPSQGAFFFRHFLSLHLYYARYELDSKLFKDHK